ncbi:MAG: Ca-activated chloride channel [Thermomicrobiales bacterium]|nr:Ca-activated chloride channel [Thermomicrobiales bacterium]
MLVGLLLTLSGLSALAWTPGARTASAQDENTQQSATAINVELILDSSGSMEQDVGGGETRMQAAKRVMKDVIAAIPEREGINVGFRIYGHKGNNTEAGRAESCQSSDLLVPIEGVDKEALNAQVDAAKSTGWTPLTLSLERGAQDFKPPTEGVVNAMVMVTDGLETCGGDPCAAAKAIHEGNVKATIHVVGFGLTEEEQGTIACIAENGGGRNLSAANAAELSAALFTILEELQVVVTTGFLEIEAFGDIFPRARIQGGTQATDTNPQGEAVDITLTDSNKVELNVGAYDVSWMNPSGQETKIRVNIESDRTTWIRGSLLKFPQGAGEIYVVTDLAGVVIWQDQFEQGDFVWVLPGIYRMELLERVGDPVLIMAEVQTLPGTATQLEIFTAGS